MEKSAAVGDWAVGGASEDALGSGYAASNTETSGSAFRRERVRTCKRLGGLRLLNGGVKDETRAEDKDAAEVLWAVRQHEGWPRVKQGQVRLIPEQGHCRPQPLPAPLPVPCRLSQGE